MDFIWGIVEEAARHLSWWQAVLLVVAVALLFTLGKAGIGFLAKLPAPESKPVDLAPGSDGSAPDDEKARKAAEEAVASGKYRYLPDDPNSPSDPSGGGG